MCGDGDANVGRALCMVDGALIADGERAGPHAEVTPLPENPAPSLPPKCEGAGGPYAGAEARATCEYCGATPREAAESMGEAAEPEPRAMPAEAATLGRPNARACTIP